MLYVIATEALWAMQEAKKIGDEFLALEKYVNLNYLVSCWRLRSLMFLKFSTSTSTSE